DGAVAGVERVDEVLLGGRDHGVAPSRPPVDVQELGEGGTLDGGVEGRVPVQRGHGRAGENGLDVQPVAAGATVVLQHARAARPPPADGAGDPPAPGAAPPAPGPELEHEATMARQRAPAAVLAMGRDLPGFIAGDYRASRARLE